ncbi:MAG: TlyA family RNA methyltransferase, partial [Nitrospinaceae bacterium]
MILAGVVRLGSEVVDKPGRLFERTAPLEVVADPNPYVSRGGLKLEHALAALGVDPAGRQVLDAGASTGGFTDCLLQHGAARVFAVDVGYGQLDWKLRTDPRVTVIDRQNARHLTLSVLGEKPLDLAVIDVSFISVTRILPTVFSLLKPEGSALALVKPQFEVGKDEVEHKGVIKNPEKHLKAVRSVAAGVHASGWEVCAATPSPLLGPKGNREFFILCRRAGQG